jgi:group II intron reverse transcriptase/maturase
MVLNVLGRIESLRIRNVKNANAVNKDLYRLLCSRDLSVISYNKIKSKTGNVTPGTDKTLNGFSEGLLLKTISNLKDQSFKFKPVRRKYMPKGTSEKTRHLGVPSPRDKVVQQSMLFILEAIYEPTFSEHSHGFRKRHSCHSSLKEVRSSWSGVKWLLEGNIKSCYDAMDHRILIRILRKKINDEKFVDLVWKLLRAGTIENGALFPLFLGTPKEGILSTLLANVYLNELDIFVQSEISNTNSLESRATNPEYNRMRGKVYRLRTVRDKNGIRLIKPSKEQLLEIKKLKKKQRTIPSKDQFDPSYKRVLFTRHADDWIIGIIGSNSLAVDLKGKIELFLHEKLKLTLSQEKIKIRCASKGNIRYLGFYLKCGAHSEVSSTSNLDKKTVAWQPKIFAPMDTIVAKLSEQNFCTKLGVGKKKKEWIYYPDNILIERYNYIIRGLRKYYSPTDNYDTSINRIQFIMRYSCAHTLAAKHRTRISKQLLRLPKLGLDIRKSLTNNIWDFKINVPTLQETFISYVRKTQLLSSDNCRICSSKENLEMRYVKAIKKDGVPIEDKYIITLMQRMNRKQICLCRTCHLNIHNGIHNGASRKL